MVRSLKGWKETLENGGITNSAKLIVQDWEGSNKAVLDYIQANLGRPYIEILRDVINILKGNVEL